MASRITAPEILSSKSLAAHVLVALAHARGASLEDLAEEIGVRRADVRAIVSRLHAEGYVDALRLKLTLPGLALAASLDGCKLPPLRAHALKVAAA